MWLKASGASQQIETYSNYDVHLQQQKISYYQCLKDFVPTIPNPSFTTINYDTNRMNFDTELIDSNLWIQRLKEIKKYDTLHNMQQAFRDIMTCYAKRNSAYVYNQS